MILEGKAHVYGDDINTDVIFPGRYLAIFEAEEMAKHALEDLDPEFVKKVETGDIVVAGKYFGCGSSREQAATCLKHAGVSAIIADSFARIFYRNAINQGLPIIACPGFSKKVKSGDIVRINIEEGEIENRQSGERQKFEPLPEFIMEIISDGGLIPNLKKRLNR